MSEGQFRMRDGERERERGTLLTVDGEKESEREVMQSSTSPMRSVAASLARLRQEQPLSLSLSPPLSLTCS